MKKFTIEQFHMGGKWLVQSFPRNRIERENYNKAILDSFKEVLRIEQLLTDFKPSSFMNINQYAGIRPVRVCEEIFNLIQKSIEISQLTKGAFDVSFASLGHYWRECKKNKSKPSLNVINHKRNFINFKKIELNETEKTIFLPHSEMRIGLGGIGKGYAVDCLFEQLRSKGLVNFLVNGSGDIRVHSLSSAPRTWRLGIRNPFNSDPNQTCGLIAVDNGAIATSGDYVNFITKEEYLSHHIINPETGLSSKGIASATVWASTSLESDTLATSMMVMGILDSLELANSKNLFALLIDGHGKVHLSKKAFQIMTKNHLKKDPVCEWH